MAAYAGSLLRVAEPVSWNIALVLLVLLCERVRAATRRAACDPAVDRRAVFRRDELRAGEGSRVAVIAAPPSVAHARPVDTGSVLTALDASAGIVLAHLSCPPVCAYAVVAV